MKKLKKSVESNETLYAYACSCGTCSCGCGCSCGDEPYEVFVQDQEWDSDDDLYTARDMVRVPVLSIGGK